MMRILVEIWVVLYMEVILWVLSYEFIKLDHFVHKFVIYWKPMLILRLTL